MKKITSLTIALTYLLTACGGTTPVRTQQSPNSTRVISLPIPGLTSHHYSALSEDDDDDDGDDSGDGSGGGSGGGGYGGGGESGGDPDMQTVFVPGQKLDANNDGIPDWYFSSSDPDYQSYVGQFMSSTPTQKPSPNPQCNSACDTAYNSGTSFCNNAGSIKKVAICYAAATVVWGTCRWYCSK